DGALVAVDFAEAHLEEPFQQTVHRFGPEDLGEWRRIGEVAEENRHLLALAFEGVARVQDALGQIGRRISAGWAEARTGRSALRPAARPAKRGARVDRGGTLRTRHREGCAAVLAEVQSGPILRLALGTDHATSPHRHRRRQKRRKPKAAPYLRQ